MEDCENLDDGFCVLCDNCQCLKNYEIHLLELGSELDDGEEL